jgi:hypothetical protein
MVTEDSAVVWIPTNFSPSGLDPRALETKRTRSQILR